MNNPWQTLSVKAIYENPWISLSEAQVINPNGGQGIYGVVHFKNKAIGVLPIDDQGYTWLVGQYRYATDEYSWELPEGGGPLNEPPLASAQRELREETGIIAQQWREILQMKISNSVTDEHCYVFLAQELSQGATDEEECEQLHLRRLPLTEAIEMVLRGEIMDSISVATLLWARVQGLG